MDRLRKPLFVAALVLAGLVVLLEIGSLAVLEGVESGLSDIGDLIPTEGELFDVFQDHQSEVEHLASQDKPPGLAVPYMALLDVIMLFTALSMGLSQLINQRLYTRINAVATLILSLLILIGGIVMIITAIVSLLLMVSLLLAVPFGTLVYLAIYGFFNRGGASAALGLLMVFKLAFSICLVLAHQRFLQNKGLVILIICSFLGNVIISLLHGFVPIFLVSITDAIGAIVVAIIAVVWAVVLLVSAIIALVRQLGS